MDSPDVMAYVIHWAGFVGAWLLVAGPLLQGAIELREEEIDREGFEALRGKVDYPAPISRWWWLLPPVAYVKNRRRNDAFHRQAMAVMTPATGGKQLALAMARHRGNAIKKTRNPATRSNRIRDFKSPSSSTGRDAAGE